MKKKYKVLIGILALLIIIRLILPFAVKKYLNNMLADLDGYKGSVTDVDLALYRGAYRIDSLYIYSTTQDLGRPFFKTDGVDLSISWKDIFKGSVVGKVVLESPELNFVGVKSETDSIDTGEDVDWTKPVKSLLPININLFTIKDGRVNYIDDYSDPKVDVYLRNIHFSIDNIRNVDNNDNPLPSIYSLSAVSIGDGNLQADGKANLLREIPNFDLDFKFEEADLTALNNFFKAYAWFDFERGDFNLYSEMALVDSSLDGYFKPVMNDIQVLDWREEEEGFFNKLYQGVVGSGLQIVKNHKEDQTATRVKISGTVSDSEVGVFSAIIELIRNAFVRPLRKDIERRIMVRGKDIIVKDNKEVKDDENNNDENSKVKKKNKK